jgi:hypothetical protein
LKHSLPSEVQDEPQPLSTLLHGGPFWNGPDSMVAPHLPVGSPERAALFDVLRETFASDWKAAEKAWRDEQREGFGDLYFVSAGAAIKIGRTTNFPNRLRFIQGHNHEKVECLGLFEGQGWRERRLHRRFADMRLRGEWFERCPEILAEIKRLSA